MTAVESICFLSSAATSTMARPKHDQPTPAELEVLKFLWEFGPATVRQVQEGLHGDGPGRAYTSVMSLLNVMTEKGYVRRKPQGRAFVYSAKLPREQTLAGMVGDLWRRAFEGSASSLVTHLLEEAHPSEDELDEIRRTLEAYRREQGDA